MTVPIYVYRCAADESCGTFEAIQKHTDAPPPCPDCGAASEKQPAGSSFAFVTKGGNLFNFSGAAGPIRRHRSKKPVTIGKNNGLGSDRRRKASWDPVRKQVQAGLAEARVAALRKP